MRVRLSARVVSVSSVQGDEARSHKDQAARGPGDRQGAATEITLQNAVQSKHCISGVSLSLYIFGISIPHAETS